MEDEQKERIIGHLETIVKRFNKISKKHGFKYYEVGEGEKIHQWNADITLTSNPKVIYFSTYDKDKSLEDTPGLRSFPDSLLLRVSNGGVESLMSLLKIPIRSWNDAIVDNLRKTFYEHEKKGKMISYPLSIGEINFRTYGEEVGDGFQKTLFNSGAIIPMKLFGISKKTMVPGCVLSFGGPGVYLPRGFRLI